MEFQQTHILDLIKEQIDAMFPAERKAADYILEHPETASSAGVAELAEQSGTSEASIIRMCKRLGYSGFYQFKLCLSTELGYICLLGQRKEPSGQMGTDAVLHFLARNMIGLGKGLDFAALSAAAALLQHSDRVYMLAAGNSIPCALDFTFRLCRIGIRASCNTIIENTLNDLALARENETVVVISHSGSSKQVLRGMELARSRGAAIVLLTSSSRNSAALMADHCICIAPETPLITYYGIESHLFDSAVIDLLLYQILSQKGEDGVDQVEMLLSEFKE